MADLSSVLAQYQKQHRLTTKGKLATVLYVTRLARKKGLPLNGSILRTERQGQVQGLSKTAVQAILREYDITRVLAEECGRTSRGSLGHMEDYVSFLNQLHEDGEVDTAAVEAWWVDRVRDFFSAQPFILKYDTGKSLRMMVKDLLAQATKRQRENPGTMYTGAVLQHLVGAKLSLILPDEPVQHHGYSVADAISARTGDFCFHDVVIHVTTAPSEALMRKCASNLDSGLRPLIITTADSMAGAESLAIIQGIAGRIDILEAEQFIATNVYELSFFRAQERKITVERIINRYNEVVEDCETDPSLKVNVG